MVNFSTVTIASVALLLSKIVAGAPVAAAAEPLHVQYFSFAAAYPGNYETLSFQATVPGYGGISCGDFHIAPGGKLASIPETSCSSTAVTNSIDVNGTAATLYIAYGSDNWSYGFPEGSIITDSLGTQHLAAPSEFDM